jgi:hypothetical protein
MLARALVSIRRNAAPAKAVGALGAEAIVAAARGEPAGGWAVWLARAALLLAGVAGMAYAVRFARRVIREEAAGTLS